MSLVEVVDEVLELLENDERMRFTLDGQLATVDDYLEIRPEAEERIRALVQAGRLAIGPWQTLVDEFLVSGETTVRNLEAGRIRAEELGGAMPVGYLPDMFGHIAQMPQILRAAGIGIAVVWRGVPAAVDSHTFAWEGPDGSLVRVEYLPEGGYSNAAWSFGVGGEGLDGLLERLRPWFGDDTVLGMVGTDHMPPLHDLVERVRERARVGTLAEYLTEPRTDGLRRVRGELRSGARANLLPNVVSARIDIKQACARAERALERCAEPLQALYGGEWPDEFFRIAWSRLFQNAAHDSVCGCSADEVSAQVLVRYAEAEQIGAEITRRALMRIAGRAPADSVVVVNPSPHPRTEVVELAARDGTVLASVSAPPLGWTAVRPSEQRSLAGSRVEVDGPTLRNQLAVFDLSSIRIVDGGDFGDSYNYAPPHRDLVVDEPTDEQLEVVEEGALRARLVIRRTYAWPRGVEPDGSRRTREMVSVPVELHAELRAGEPFVRCRVAFDNPCDDHRVRLHVPLQAEARRTYAEGQFAVVERPPRQEGGHGEQGLGVYPASAFVAAGGVGLLFEHVTEYELVDGRELAVTALRSIGLISRVENPWRAENAGPELPIPAAQMRGPHSFSFAWCGDPGRVLEQAERYRHPFLTAQGDGSDGELRDHAGPELTGALLSSLRRRNGVLEARIVNETAEARPFSFGAERGRLRPWEIRTLTLNATPT
jgi:Glycosyl hydrolases family 38 N-terminal domain/Alpha mannosidase middle domain/Glycosyl hydrolases family 38 C-terminal domain